MLHKSQTKEEANVHLFLPTKTELEGRKGLYSRGSQQTKHFGTKQMLSVVSCCADVTDKMSARCLSAVN